jgi:hypothetical protein
MRRRTLVLILVALTPVVIGLVAYLHESDEDAIEKVAEDCRQAILARDVERVLAHLEENAELAGLVGSGPLAPVVKRRAGQKKGGLRKLDLSLREIVVDGEDARGVWLAKGNLRESQDWGDRVLALARVDFHRSPAGWLVRRVEIARPR